ncbi:MAG TPA: hypothetical protein PKJ41_04430 [Bryobacteraceae bacterium]|nr:hypothetical protein [Bryobacteraceae bacterium]HPT26699.1 hypothetical protein [Bryobacteraceae bacterium]
MKPIRYILGFVVVAGLAFGADAVLLGLVPADARMVAGLDVDRARNSAFGQKILNEIKEEDSGFRKLVDETGFDPRRDLRSVVMASSGVPAKPGAMVAVRGTFDITRITQLAQGKGAVSNLYRGIQLWSPPATESKGQGAVAFLDTSLAVFGSESAVKAAIDAKLAGKSAMPAALAAKVNQWSGHDAWFVSTASLGEMGVGKTGQNAILPGGLAVDSIKEAAAGVRFFADVQISGDVLTRSAQDATALADVMRFLANMIRLNAPQTGAEPAIAVADSLQVNVNGASAIFALTVPQGVLDQMFQNRARKATRAAVR